MNIIANIVEALGLGIFIFYLIRGLKTKIVSLESTVNIQNQTLDVMEKRISETEKVGDIYKNLISDLPQDLDNYKTILSKTKDETIVELKNQNETARKKLDEAEQKIQNSPQSPELIKHHLKVLKNLLSANSHKKAGLHQKYDLESICENGDRTLEHCVPLIIESRTVEEFLSKAGFDVSVTDDNSVSKNIFGGSNTKRLTPKGVPIQNAQAKHSITGAWFVIANNEFYINQIQLDELKDEFSSIKTIS